MDNQIQKTFGDWQLSIDQDGVAYLVLDVSDTSANVLSRAVLLSLNQALDVLSETEHGALVFCSAKDSGFIAGADVKEVSALVSEEEVRALVSDGWNTMMRVARWSKTTISKIHGFCFGGGLELALACQFRIASDDPSTKFALPEVRLGILPGWGGVMRLPQLIGSVQALDLLLSGRTVRVKSARKMGLVDVVVPRRVLDIAVRSYTVQNPHALPKRKKLSFFDNLLTNTVLRSVPIYAARRSLAKKVRFVQYPAPYIILDVWKKFSGNPLVIPNDHPSSPVKLFQHKTTHGLLRVFSLQERLKSLGKKRPDQEKVQHVHILGAGVMGGDVAAWCAARGIRVTIEDMSSQQIASTIKRALTWYQKKLKDPLLIQKALDCLIPDPSASGISHADIVFEAVVEKLDVKQKLFKRFEQEVRPDALLVTNTSSIMIERISEVLSSPERLAGLHFFNPVNMMPLVEVVMGEKTSPDVVDRLTSFVRQIDKLPLPVKSTPGFLVNRVLGPYILEALLILDAEGLSPDAIDAGIRRFGMPMGPVELADFVGLDVCLAAGQEMSVSQCVPESLNRLVSEKKLGRKTKHGYYVYDNRLKPVRSHRCDPISDDMVSQIMKPLYEWTKRCVQEGVVADEDLADAGMVFGAGFAPFSGGPLFHLKNGGHS